MSLRWISSGSLRLVLFIAGSSIATASASAQISLSTAVNLAMQNNPRVKLAGTDLARAKAVLAETKEAFVPAVSTTAGVGRQTGVPLYPPVIFSISAQSLVFNFSQPDYIRAARSGLVSAQLALQVARIDSAEDTTNTYLALDNALQRLALQKEALAVATRLVNIVQARLDAGVDPHIELTRARRTAAQMHLQQLVVEDEIAGQAEHLAMLTGLPASGLMTVHQSVPKLRMPAAVTETADTAKGEGLSAAFASAQARAYTAHGEKRYLLRPQIGFSAQYSRISTAFSSYDQYYPGFNPVNNPNISYNSLSVGLQVTLPLVDMVHRARARESAADATHALFDAQIQQNNFFEGRQRLRHNTSELGARAELAELDHDLAQDELDTVRIRLRAEAGTVSGPPSTPKDEENAQLAERQRTIDMLNAELQLQQAEVSLMRQEGSLTNWLGATLPGGGTAAPATVAPDSTPAALPSVGTEPGTSAPNGTNPAVPTIGTEPGTAAPDGGTPVVPTTGASPSSLPSSPVSSPAPSSPPSQPSPPSTPSPHP